jgi:hypothetical protein
VPIAGMVRDALNLGLDAVRPEQPYDGKQENK